MRLWRQPRSFPALPLPHAPSWLPPLLCLLAGCAALEPPWKPCPVPPQVTVEGMRDRMSATAPESSAELAEQPACAEPDGGPRFSLPQAIDFGLQNSPRLRAALAAIDRARGQEQAAFAPFLPQVDFLFHSGDTSKALGPNSAGPTGIILASPTGNHPFVQAEMQLQWILCDFGRTLGRYRQAGARAHISELQYARAKETVSFDVAAAYLQALRAGAVRLIQEEAILRAEAILKDTRSRRAAGVAEKDDVLRAEVQLSAARDALDLAQEAELAALARLNNFMGRSAGLPLQLVDWSSEPGFGLSLGQCLEIAAGQRPEIGAARESVAVAQFGRQVTAADYLPRIYTLSSVGDVEGQNVQPGLQAGTGIHIDWTLFAGGRRKGELHAADAEIREAIANAESVVDNVTLEVTLAYRSVTTAQKRIGYLRPAITEAREFLRLVRNRYRNGNATPTDIVDAETALTGAQQRLSSATYEYLAALAQLDYALGNPPGCSLAGKQPAGEERPEAEALPAPRPAPEEELR